MKDDFTDSPNEPTEKPKSAVTLIALCLGFAPAAFVVCLITFNPNTKPGMAQVAFLGTVFCCFISSFMLFSRRTNLAIVAGILLLLLNAVIAFGFGCAAMFGA